MRDYGVVSPKFWIGETGKALRGDAEAQLLALYLMTCPHANMIGVFHCPVLYMSHETGIPFEGASKALARLSEAQFCTYDEATETVFVHRMAAYQIGEQLSASDNRVKSVAKEWGNIGALPLKAAFLATYADAFHLPKDSADQASPSKAPSKPLRSQEQEQEQYRTKAPSAEPPGFTSFWSIWPTGGRKGGKGKCLEVWLKANLEPHAAQILAHVEAMKLSTGWTKQNGEFIPAPLVYLNGRRWEGAEVEEAHQESFV